MFSLCIGKRQNVSVSISFSLQKLQPFDGFLAACAREAGVLRPCETRKANPFSSETATLSFHGQSVLGKV